MYRAVIDRITDEFEFEEVETKDLYYKDPQRAIVELDMGGSDLKRVCFVHRGHPEPHVPQWEYWTCSDLETGLAVGYKSTAKKAIEHAQDRCAREGATRDLLVSVIAFIDENGRANPQPNRPIIKEGTVIAWRDEDEKLKWAPVKSKRDHLNPDNGVACLVTHHPTEVVAMEDILYVWPTKEDLCPSN